MAKVIAYEVEIKGIKTVISNQDDLTAAIKETTRAYKEADFGTDDYKASEKELAKLKNLQKSFAEDVKKSAREQEIAADKGRDSYRALNAELTNLRNRYRDLTREERKVIGPDLLNRIQDLDEELKDIDASMGQYQRNVGNYASAFAGLGGIDLAAFASVPGAIVAVGTAAIQAGKYLFDMSEQVRTLRGEIETLTNASGEQLDSFTSRVLAIGDTFDQVPSEVARAANAVADQLGIPFEQALAKIEEGFIAGTNVNGEFLQSLSEYPAFFKEAELGADALFAVLNRSAEQGIYSDKGVDTIKEATLRLRELPTATIAALEGIGLQGEEIRKQIAEEGVGAAIATVSERLGELRADSPEVGTAIADIFGGPGEDAGLNFILTLKDINEETGSLIDQSSAYQQQQLKTLQINKDFAAVQVEVANAIGGTGVQFEQIGTIIQTKLLEFVLFLVDRFRAFAETIKPLQTALFELGQALGLVDTEGRKTEAGQKALNAIFKAAELPLKAVVFAVTEIVKVYTGFINKGKEVLAFLGLLKKEQQGTAKATQETIDELLGYVGASDQQTKAQKKQQEETKKTKQETENLNSSLGKSAKAVKEAAVATDQYAKGSIAALRDEVQKLRKEIDSVAPENQRPLLEKLFNAEAALKEVEDYQKALRSRFEGGQIEPLSLLPPPDIQELEIEDYAKKIIDAQKKVSQQTAEEQINSAELVAQVQQEIFAGIATTIQELSSLSAATSEQQIAQLEKRYEKEISLAEGNEAKQEQLEKELSEKRAQLEKQEFERQKRFRRAAALTSYAEGVVNILAAPSTIPDPFGSIFKAVRIGLLTKTLATQLATIDKQQAARGAIVKNIARGASHVDYGGGIDVLLNGQPFSIESGEFVDSTENGGIAVVNKRSSAAFRPLLDSIAGTSFAGKADLLSSVNAYKNLGIRYAEDGAFIRPDSAITLQQSSGQGVAQIKISAESIALIANATAAAVRSGAEAGTMAGVIEGETIKSREFRRRQRTGF